MSRLFFSRGSRGLIITQIQSSLRQEGYYPGNIDGWFGGVTEKNIHFYQMDNQMPATGAIDATTWQAIMKRDPPSLYERCLQVTAVFEGHGFGVVAGNYDGAGVTWGIIGFTLKAGSLKRVILEVWERNPEIVTDCFGNRASELVNKMQAPLNTGVAWANSISEGTSKHRVIEPWRSAFMRFGENRTVQNVQIQHAHDEYYLPAVAAAKQYELKEELGVGLCFDIQVQNGGIKKDAQGRIKKFLNSNAGAHERALRQVIADAVADNAKPQWREAVRRRKQTFATGSGVVNQESIDLSRWGLGEFPWTSV
jgi:peptidoglycan hydrolase-like protein with peptidoglycan-binding domain